MGRPGRVLLLLLSLRGSVLAARARPGRPPALSLRPPELPPTPSQPFDDIEPACLLDPPHQPTSPSCPLPCHAPTSPGRVGRPPRGIEPPDAAPRRPSSAFVRLAPGQRPAAVYVVCPPASRAAIIRDQVRRCVLATRALAFRGRALGADERAVDPGFALVPSPGAASSSVASPADADASASDAEATASESIVAAGTFLPTLVHLRRRQALTLAGRARR